MASGYEYRANRPNTWLLRLLLQSEDSSCQPGAVHTWPFATYCTAALPSQHRATTAPSTNDVSAKMRCMAHHSV